MFGLFKKKLTSDEMAISYLNNLVTTIENHMENDQVVLEQAIVDFQGGTYTFESLNHFNFEVLVAIIPLEFEVLKNKFPDKYVSITQSIYRNIGSFTNYEEAEDYALSTIQEEYIPQIESGIRNGIMPHESVVSILLNKLNIDYSPIVSIVLTEILIKKIGFWKYALKKYRVGA